jgi:hypothetical protein
MTELSRENEKEPKDFFSSFLLAFRLNVHSQSTGSDEVMFYSTRDVTRDVSQVFDQERNSS